MTFVIAQPELVQAAASELAAIRSSLAELSATTAVHTTGLMPAAADEVSNAIAALFGNFGGEFQAVSAQAAMFHDRFVNLLNGSAAAYISTETANGAALVQNMGAHAAAQADSAIATAFGAGPSGLALPAAQFNAPLSASSGNGLRALGGVFNGGLNGMLGTGQTLGANLANNFGGGLGVNLPALTTNLGAGLSGLGAPINAALLGSFNGGFFGVSGLVDTAAGLPTVVVQQAGQATAGALTGLVNAELAVNHAVVANEVALQQAVFGTSTAFNGAVNFGFNAANLLGGTGEQAVNVLLGAPMPESFTASLLIGSPGGGAPIGGLVGAVQQALLLNAALGGPPVLDASLLARFGPAQLANLVAGQLAFNHGLVANELALQHAVFGTNSAFNGALDHADNIFNLTVGTGQQTADVLLGAPMPTDFTASLLATGPGDIFPGFVTGGVLGAVVQKFLMDGAFVSTFGFPVQALLDGRLPLLAAQLGLALTGGFAGGLPDLSGLAHTGTTLIGGFNAGLAGLAGGLGVNLPALTTNLGAGLSGLGAQFNAETGGMLGTVMQTFWDGYTPGQTPILDQVLHEFWDQEIWGVTLNGELPQLGAQLSAA